MHSYLSCYDLSLKKIKVVKSTKWPTCCPTGSRPKKLREIDSSLIKYNFGYSANATYCSVLANVMQVVRHFYITSKRDTLNGLDGIFTSSWVRGMLQGKDHRLVDKVFQFVVVFISWSRK